MAHDNDLNLGMVGNGTVSALIDRSARVVWMCLPQFDGDPAFCALLEPRQEAAGFWSIELEDLAHCEQRYLDNTAILVTRLSDRNGGCVEITDFTPRYRQFGRFYHPVMLVRRLVPVSGAPRLRVRLRPLADYGARVPERTWGSNHVRFLLSAQTMRLTTDLSLPLLLQELPFVLERPVSLVFGPDETLTQAVESFVRDAYENTVSYWHEWVRALNIPLEWQDEVIRAAITLKLCQFEGTGAIVAAMTTSIPEAPHTPRNWDYRYCWLRDAAFVVRALNRLGATRTMEEYLRYIFNIASGPGELQPVYGITYEAVLAERTLDSLGGYRGMGPVRAGNLAYLQRQHDVYGSVILASTQLFFDRRLTHPGDAQTFARLEPLGQVAERLHDQPDAGLWEYRGRSNVHTYSSMMCWVACDRLAKIAQRLGLGEASARWRISADGIREGILARAWSERRRSFVDSAATEALDASLLFMADVGFIGADDPRFRATVEAIGRELKRGDYLFRYVAADDFGHPETAFTICSFWYVDALAAIGRREEARELFQHLLGRRNHLGLLSEDLDPQSGELWGNYPQTYSLVGLINSAMKLSRAWEDAV
ncbi:MAG TPA: glycoside hydrolase family 15 protein [Candidatus Competibacteraceae bacterium]|nr:glycoside hydrolase family 15 protein [Candidatus Competibacteraceae bacterium]